MPGANSFGSSLDIPTLTVIVVDVTASISTIAAFPTGSPVLVYECSEAWLSASEVNVTTRTTKATLLEVVKLCEPISTSIRPVSGS